MWRLYKTTYDTDWDQIIVERFAIMEGDNSTVLQRACAEMNRVNPLRAPADTRNIPARPRVLYTVEGCD